MLRKDGMPQMTGRPRQPNLGQIPSDVSPAIGLGRSHGGSRHTGATCQTGPSGTVSINSFGLHNFNELCAF